MQYPVPHSLHFQIRCSEFGVVFQNAFLIPARQPDAEDGFAGLTFNFDAALMFLNDLAADVQPQSAALTGGFGGKKRLENPRFDLVRNARAGIGNADNHKGKHPPTPLKEGLIRSFLYKRRHPPYPPQGGIDSFFPLIPP